MVLPTRSYFTAAAHTIAPMQLIYCCLLPILWTSNPALSGSQLLLTRIFTELCSRGSNQFSPRFRQPRYLSPGPIVSNLWLCFWRDIWTAGSFFPILGSLRYRHYSPFSLSIGQHGVWTIKSTNHPAHQSSYHIVSSLPLIFLITSVIKYRSISIHPTMSHRNFCWPYRRGTAIILGIRKIRKILKLA
jgi:hypothetical protein